MSSKHPLTIAIVAGEESGDYLGAQLIDAIRSRHPDVRVSGIGGPRMKQAGAELLYSMETISVIGLDGLIPKLGTILRIRKELKQRFLTERPDIFVGIDVPDFNLALERRLRRAGIPAVHYVSPTVWAWRGYRIGRIRQSVDHMLVLFPFEKTYYDKHQVPSTYIGHPLADEIGGDRSHSDARRELGLDEHGTLVAILPGSRRSELDRHSDVFLETADRLLRTHSDLKFVAPLVNEATAEQFRKVLARQSPQLRLATDIRVGCAREAMSAANVVLLASGTAALEAALLRRPMVVAYRVSRFTQWMVQLLGHVDVYSMPNHLTDVPVVPEFMQDSANPVDLSAAVEQYIDCIGKAREQTDRFAVMHAQLRGPGSTGAANVIINCAMRSNTRQLT